MFEGFLLVVPIMLCIALGWFLFRRRILTSAGVGDMNRFIYYVAMPSMLFRAMQGVEASHFADWRFLVVLHGGYILTLVAAWSIGLARKRERPQLAVSVLSAIRANNVFIGMPAVALAYGSAGLEAYGRLMALSMVGFELFSVVAGLLVISGDLSIKVLKGVLIRMTRNPMLIACCAGIIYALSVPVPFPRWLDYSIEIMANTGTGVALVVLGARIRLELLAQALKRCWSDLLVRLIICPLFLMLGFLALPIDPMLARVTVLVMAMPVSVNTLALSEGLGMDGFYASEIIVATTLCSVITIPFWTPVLTLL